MYFPDLKKTIMHATAVVQCRLGVNQVLQH